MALYKNVNGENILMSAEEETAHILDQQNITNAYNLPVKHVIHAVGTTWHGGKEHTRFYNWLTYPDYCCIFILIYELLKDISWNILYLL